MGMDAIMVDHSSISPRVDWEYRTGIIAETPDGMLF